ncbi:MAG: glycerophosphodiester phosphodiesterase family protein [Synechococcales cyanobacterium]
MTLIIAHRGDHRHAEENTLEAFASALHTGADMIELDVRRTQDGIPVIFHDATLGHERLDQLTWAEIQTRQPTIPTLSATLAYTRGRIRLDIELKEAGYEAEILALIRTQGDPSSVVITSFLPQVVYRVKTLAPDLTVGLLVDERPLVSDPDPQRQLEMCRQLGADLWAPHHSWLTSDVLRVAAQGGIPLYVWTVNDPMQIRVCLQNPIMTGLITDVPQMALAERGAVP